MADADYATEAHSSLGSIDLGGELGQQETKAAANKTAHRNAKETANKPSTAASAGLNLSDEGIDEQAKLHSSGEEVPKKESQDKSQAPTNAPSSATPEADDHAIPPPPKASKPSTQERCGSHAIERVRIGGGYVEVDYHTVTRQVVVNGVTRAVSQISVSLVGGSPPKPRVPSTRPAAATLKAGAKPCSKTIDTTSATSVAGAADQAASTKPTPAEPKISTNSAGTAPASSIATADAADKGTVCTEAEAAASASEKGSSEHLNKVNQVEEGCDLMCLKVDDAKQDN